MSTRQPDPGPDHSATSDSDLDFRWTGFFQRSTLPLFVLSRRRQILFVNRSWELQTGFSAKEVRMQVCKRLRNPTHGTCEPVLHAMAPPREALEGKAVQARRAFIQSEAARRWWDVDFTPILGPKGIIGILGVINVIPGASLPAAMPLPEKLVNLRQRLSQWWSLKHLPTQMPALRGIAAQARLASRTAVPTMIVGESGSGKHWLARAIHNDGPNRLQPFFSVDCQRLPPPALAWLLFGPPRAARRSGATLYIREPSHLPRELQARLSEELSEATDHQPTPHVIAGTSTDPAADVKAGRLLEELRCALSQLTIHLPLLRDRSPDLTLLVERMLQRASSGRDTRISGLTEEAWEIVRVHKWPGNIRELYAVIAGACAKTKGNQIEANDLPWYLRSGPAVPPRALNLDQILEQAERRMMEWALHTAKGNKSKAAEMLAISRPRLMRRMEALGIKLS